MYSLSQFAIKKNNIIPSCVNNLYIINLIGSYHDIDLTANEMNEIAKNFNLRTKFISIRPYKLSIHPNNREVKWRVELENILLSSDEHILINKVGKSNCDEIADLNNSIRALDRYRHPWTFLIVPDLKKANDSIKNFNCNHINQIWSLKTCPKKKIKDLASYIKP